MFTDEEIDLRKDLPEIISGGKYKNEGRGMSKDKCIQGKSQEG